MTKKAISVALFCLCFSACFKKTHLNENALLHQKACVESITLHDYVRAQTHCELCLEYDASMPECLNGIGLVALMNKDEDKAQSFFTKALRQDNDYSQARNNLGVIYFSHGDFDAALKYFERALEIDPSNTDARYNSGLSYFRLGQRMRAHNDRASSIKHLLMAKDQIQKLLAIEPTYHSAFRDLGLIDLNLYDLQDFEVVRHELLGSAKRAFSHCAEAEKDNDGCYEGLAQVFFEEGRYDLSFANYFSCLTYSPKNSACRSGIVVAYEKSAQAEGGYKRFKKNVSENPQDAFAHEAFCAALFERGLNDAAAKECEAAVSLKPNLCSAQLRLAEYFAAVLNPDKAASHCRAFLACDNKRASSETKKCQEILATIGS